MIKKIVSVSEVIARLRDKNELLNLLSLSVVGI